MKLDVSPTKIELGQRAAAAGADLIRQEIARQGSAAVIVATGASQFEMLSALVAAPKVDWSVVTFFHLDEYAGMSVDHPASFRKYLRERLVEKLPTPPRAFHYIDAESACQPECERLARLIEATSIDVAFIGIGENGHLAFNDPPADLQTTQPYLVVQLDEACRQQQFGEGWFATLEDVPREAISMSVLQIMKSKSIICSVPDERKATAVKNALTQELSPQFPAVAITQHPNAYLFIDEPAASQLTPSQRTRWQ